MFKPIHKVLQVKNAFFRLEKNNLLARFELELRQRPPFAGQTSGGPLGQLIPPGDPLPSENGANFGPEGLAAVELGNRNKETPLGKEKRVKR